MELKPIGIEEQLNSALFGKSADELFSISEKVNYVKRHIDEVVSINGKPVFYPIVKGNDIWYCLSKAPAAIEDILISSDSRKYYYPIQYANIVIGSIERG